MAGRELPAGFIGFANYCIRYSYDEKNFLHEHPGVCGMTGHAGSALITLAKNGINIRMMLA